MGLKSVAEFLGLINANAKESEGIDFAGLFGIGTANASIKKEPSQTDDKKELPIYKANDEKDTQGRSSPFLEQKLKEAGVKFGYDSAEIRKAFADTAKKNRLDESLLMAQAYQESQFNPNAISPKGAKGFSQFMPETAKQYGLTDPANPIKSIEAQGRMMRDLMDKFKNDEALALAGYNAGPNAVTGGYHKSNGSWVEPHNPRVPDYPETKDYLKKIAKYRGDFNAPREQAKNHEKGFFDLGFRFVYAMAAAISDSNEKAHFDSFEKSRSGYIGENKANGGGYQEPKESKEQGKVFFDLGARFVSAMNNAISGSAGEQDKSYQGALSSLKNIDAYRNALNIAQAVPSTTNTNSTNNTSSTVINTGPLNINGNNAFDVAQNFSQEMKNRASFQWNTGVNP
jgi:hypothetical protein